MKSFWLLLVFLAGCAAPPPSHRAAPADLGELWYHLAESAGARILRVDARQSLIAVTARRGGALERLGHDHIIASRAIDGFVAPDAGRADFHFRLDEMTVDEPALRREAGFDSAPSDDAIAGTRRNMLTRVLEADRFPVVVLHAERLAASASIVRLTVTLHGVARTVDVPAHIEYDAAGVTAAGTLSLLQSEFGITPMSLLGGAIAVRDRMDLRFRIVARAAPR